jgi:hypothetical protein
MSHFEITLKGFDGGTDATDHLVIWVSAPVTYVGEVEDMLDEIGVDGLFESVTMLAGHERIKASNEGIDFYLPSQLPQLEARIRELCRVPLPKWGNIYTIVKRAVIVVNEPNDQQKEELRSKGIDPEDPKAVANYMATEFFVTTYCGDCEV